MKWTFAITLFLYPIVALGEDCTKPPLHSCPLPVSVDNLRSAQAVKNICPAFIKYIACLGKFDETCGDEAPRRVFESEGEFESVRDLIADICDENSLLHTVLMGNVQCIVDGAYKDPNNTCYGDRNEISRSLSIDYDDEERSFSTVEMCFANLYRPTCYLEFVVRNCGILTKDALIEVFHRSYFLRNSCSPEAALDFSDVIHKVEMRQPLKDIMKQMVQRILKKAK